ncbi:hypothetical protein ACKKBG_A30525 [Auxenochlorella protothecoides x Auxenochlorella symbiontica]
MAEGWWRSPAVQPHHIARDVIRDVRRKLNAPGDLNGVAHQLARISPNETISEQDADALVSSLLEYPAECPLSTWTGAAAVVAQARPFLASSPAKHKLRRGIYDAVLLRAPCESSTRTGGQGGCRELLLLLVAADNLKCSSSTDHGSSGDAVSCQDACAAALVAACRAAGPDDGCLGPALSAVLELLQTCLTRPGASLSSSTASLLSGAALELLDPANAGLLESTGAPLKAALAASSSPRPVTQKLSSNSRMSSATSDSEGEGLAGTPAGIKRAALVCLQAAVKVDPRSFHQHWPALLRGSSVPGNQQTPSVVSALAHDASPRVRLAAAASIATLLQGVAQAAYLGLAEVAPGGRTASFIPLSERMGHLVTRLHSQLLAALCSESQARVRAGTLRALGTLAVGSPYSRLPPELASETLEAVLSRLTAPPPTAQDLPALLACLAAVVCHTAGVPFPCPAIPAATAALLRLAATSAPAQQLDALITLRGLAAREGGALGPTASALESLLAAFAPHLREASGATAQAAAQMLRLLADVAARDAQRTQAVLTLVRRAPALHLGATNPPPVAAPEVRAALCTLGAALWPADAELAERCVRAAQADDASAVRAAAAQAAAGLVERCRSERAPAAATPGGHGEQTLRAALDALGTLGRDPVLAVRLAVARALAPDLCARQPALLALALALGADRHERVASLGLERAAASLRQRADAEGPGAAARDAPALAACLAGALRPTRPFKVQWAACGLARALLEVRGSAGECVAVPAPDLVPPLLEGALSSPSERTRALCVELLRTAIPQMTGGSLVLVLQRLAGARQGRQLAGKLAGGGRGGAMAQQWMHVSACDCVSW